MNQDPWTWSCDRSIPSDAKAGRRFLNEVLRQLKARQWPAHDIFGVHLAMEEALVNAIMHGNGGDPQKHVRLRCGLTNDRIRIEIADEGPGFNPRSIPDPTDPDRLESPCGRGLMLMRSFMSEVEYNDSGNQVTLEKRRTE